MKLIGVLALAGLWLQASGAAPPTGSSTDLDGDGSPETAQAIVRGKKIRLEVWDARGKKLAAETVPSPGSRNTSVVIESGSLGSAGALLAVVAAEGGQECRSVWRYRDGDLHRLPVRGAGVLPDCVPAGDWVYRWERTSEDSPAVYVREKTRSTEGGPMRQREAFAFTGFALDLDLARSTSEIRGVRIPKWQAPVLYHPKALQALTDRFDLDPVRSLPRLTITADGARGVFSLRLSDPAGAVEFPVIGSETLEEPNRVRLTVQVGDGRASVEIALANGNIPVEARPHGLGERFDHVYAPVTELQGGALRIYSNADEVASAGLRGSWSNNRGESYEVLALPGPGARLRFGATEAAARIDAAPAGTDVLLSPVKGSPAAFALDLRGPNTLDRVPLRCGRGGATELLCESSGPRERLRRTGSRLNVR